MDTVQYEQPRGLASAARQYQYQPQYSWPQPMPQPTPGYFDQNNQRPQSPQNMYSPPPAAAAAAPNNYNYNYQYQNSHPQSPYDHEHPPPIPPKQLNHTFDNQTMAQYQQQPPLPQRHQNHSYDGSATTDYQYPTQYQSSYEQAPPLPVRSQSRDNYYSQANNNVVGLNGHPTPSNDVYLPPPPPPLAQASPFSPDDDPADPIHYTRDPHKLVAYLVPFPKPNIPGVDVSNLPTRFLIYTPPPPPLVTPREGEKEAKMHKVQRKWQQEVRSAKQSDAKLASWKGVKSRATKAIAWGVNQTTTSNIEFLGRVNDDHKSSGPSSPDSGRSSPTSTTSEKATVGVNEMLLVYPPTMGLNDQQMREEFVNTMLRTKSKAQRDAIIATGLLPVGFGIDILATFIWPFGGLGEIDSVWLYSSARGAKTAHSVTKRLKSSSSPDSANANGKEDTLHLNFTPSARLEILTRYLEAECRRTDPRNFPGYISSPTESEVLAAIGWCPSQTGGVEKNWEDEQWEMSEVKEDVKSNMHKGAKEWGKFCNAYAKNPEKAMGIKTKKEKK